MALSKNTPLVQVLGNVIAVGVKAATRIYEGAAIGSSSGYARPLAAGDQFLGFAESESDNSAGANGGKTVRILTRGALQLAVAAAAITDIGKPVYASDDGTFVLTATGNSHVGRIVQFVSTGIAVVEFNASRASLGTVTALTVAAGTANGALVDVGAAFDQATLNNNFADLAAKINEIAAQLG